MEIGDQDVEWAVVQRLADMLAKSATQEHNVSAALAFFTTLTGWVRQRVGDYRSYDEWPAQLNDLKGSIYGPLWGMQQGSATGRTRVRLHRSSQPKDIDLADCSAWEFLVWLRNATAHGDGRSIQPIHSKLKRVGTARELTGFMFQNDGCTVRLSDRDMRRVGMRFADVFRCAFDRNALGSDVNRFVTERAA